MTVFLPFLLLGPLLLLLAAQFTPSVAAQRHAASLGAGPADAGSSEQEVPPAVLCFGLLCCAMPCCTVCGGTLIWLQDPGSSEQQISPDVALLSNRYCAPYCAGCAVSHPAPVWSEKLPSHVQLSMLPTTTPLLITLQAAHAQKGFQPLFCMTRCPPYCSAHWFCRLLLPRRSQICRAMLCMIRCAP